MIGGIGTMCGSRGRSRHQTALSGRGFDPWQKAKGEVANDRDAAGEGEQDMFAAASVAAE